MSTPTSNSVPVTMLDTSGLGNEGAIIQGVKWGGGWGAGVSLTYSFPSAGGGYHAYPYGFYGGHGEFGDWSVLSASERTAVRSALAEWSAVANISFTEVVDNATTVGDLRFAATTVGGAAENAHAYYPWTDPSAGDVWFNSDDWHVPDAPLNQGTYDYKSIMHEIGHALGLKHTFDGTRVMPAAYDSYSYTIMSYSASTATPGSNYANFYPTTPMYYDLVAIQELYGERAHHSGHTTYIFSEGNHYWQTIDDSGGIDTIRYVGSNDVTIDLRIGHWSTLGLPISFGSGVAPQTGTVCIGPRSVIEKATGGSGDDQLIGNSSANTLVGGLGRDSLTGGSAGDYFDFNSARQTPRGIDNRDVIMDFNGALGDMIDLFNIDARRAAGDQAFRYIGDDRFERAGELRVVDRGAFFLVAGDINGDGRADFQIEVHSAVALTADDFIL
jgi:hypothetical protein